jgi:hypothetical protein
MDNVKVIFLDEGRTMFDWKNTVREKIQELDKAAKVQWDGILSCWSEFKKSCLAMCWSSVVVARV